MIDRAAPVIDRFLRLHRRLIVETREFRRLRHNDHLCPQFQLQLESICNALGRFEPVVYDTQGFSDQGADIVIRLRHKDRSDGEPPELLGFQLKSFDDFKNRDLLRVLKSQRDDALRKIRGLCCYYLVLCTDEDSDKDKIRTIESEFRTQNEPSLLNQRML